ncbi:MAG: ankyrin repeat domain-containing protein [Candidatus Omnitrophota bacterium]
MTLVNTTPVTYVLFDESAVGPTAPRPRAATSTALSYTIEAGGTLTPGFAGGCTPPIAGRTTDVVNRLCSAARRGGASAGRQPLDDEMARILREFGSLGTTVEYRIVDGAVDPIEVICAGAFGAAFCAYLVVADRLLRVAVRPYNCAADRWTRLLRVACSRGVVQATHNHRATPMCVCDAEPPAEYAARECIVRQLLERGADPNDAIHGDPPPLSLAVQARAMSALRALLSYDADPRGTDLGGQSPLHIACMLNRVEACSAILTKSAAWRIGANYARETPLYVAVRCNADPAIVEALVRRCDKTVTWCPPDCSMLPQSLACAIRNDAAMFAMLKGGMPASFTIDVRADDDRRLFTLEGSGFHMVASDFKTVRRFAWRGIDFAATPELIAAFAQAGNFTPSDLDDAVCAVAMHGTADAVRKMLMLGARSPLLLCGVALRAPATRPEAVSETDEIVDTVVRTCQCDIEARIVVGGKSCTAYEIAIDRRDVHMLTVLMHHFPGAAHAALTYAAHSPDDPSGAARGIIACLVAAGADVNRADARGLVPLAAAYHARNLPTVEALLKAGADPLKCPLDTHHVPRPRSRKNGSLKGALTKLIRAATVNCTVSL